MTTTIASPIDDVSHIIAHAAGGAPIGVGLSVSPCLPGQDVPYAFQTWNRRIGALDLGALTVTLFLVDPQGNQLPSALWTTSLPKGTSLASYDSGALTLPVIQLPSAIQNAIYAIGGDYSLRLVITGTGKDGGPFVSDDVPLQVVAETIDASWWTWSPDVPNHPIQWAVDKYTIAGAFDDRSQVPNTKMTCSAVVEELDITRGIGGAKAEFSGSPGSVQVAQGSSSPDIVFSGTGFTKNWLWYTDYIFLINPMQLRKTFQYQATLTIADAFGNTYPPIRSAPIEVSVAVSNGKQSAADGAFAAFNVWATASALTVGFGWTPAVYGFAATASAAAALLAGLGTIAKDPPSPDPEFLHAVVPAARDVAALAADPFFGALAAAFTVLHRVVANVNALSTIEGRILGAQVARNGKAETMQRAQYAQLVAQLVADGNAIPAIVTAALPALDLKNAATIEYLRSKTQVGVDPTLPPPDPTAGLSDDERALVAQLKSVPVSSESLMDPSQALDRLAAAVQQVAMAAARHAPPGTADSRVAER